MVFKFAILFFEEAIYNETHPVIAYLFPTAELFFPSLIYTFR
jgi:hypothetical protein